MPIPIKEKLEIIDIGSQTDELNHLYETPTFPHITEIPVELILDPS